MCNLKPLILTLKLFCQTFFLFDKRPNTGICQPFFPTTALEKLLYWFKSITHFGGGSIKPDCVCIRETVTNCGSKVIQKDTFIHSSALDADSCALVDVFNLFFTVAVEQQEPIQSEYQTFGRKCKDQYHKQGHTHTHTYTLTQPL